LKAIGYHFPHPTRQGGFFIGRSGWVYFGEWPITVTAPLRVGVMCLDYQKVIIKTIPNGNYFLFRCKKTARRRLGGVLAI
jgi:hypothetical protein